MEDKIKRAQVFSPEPLEFLERTTRFEIDIQNVGVNELMQFDFYMVYDTVYEFNMLS